MHPDIFVWFLAAWLLCGCYANKFLYEAKKKGFKTHTEDWIIGIILGPVVLICIAMAHVMNAMDKFKEDK